MTGISPYLVLSPFPMFQGAAKPFISVSVFIFVLNFPHGPSLTFLSFAEDFDCHIFQGRSWLPMKPLYHGHSKIIVIHSNVSVISTVAFIDCSFSFSLRCAWFLVWWVVLLLLLKPGHCCFLSTSCFGWLSACSSSGREQGAAVWMFPSHLPDTLQAGEKVPALPVASTMHCWTGLLLQGSGESPASTLGLLWFTLEKKGKVPWHFQVGMEGPTWSHWCHRKGGLYSYLVWMTASVSSWPPPTPSGRGQSLFHDLLRHCLSRQAQCPLSSAIAQRPVFSQVTLELCLMTVPTPRVHSKVRRSFPSAGVCVWGAGETQPKEDFIINVQEIRPKDSSESTVGRGMF